MSPQQEDAQHGSVTASDDRPAANSSFDPVRDGRSFSRFAGDADRRATTSYISARRRPPSACWRSRFDSQLPTTSAHSDIAVLPREAGAEHRHGLDPPCPPGISVKVLLDDEARVAEDAAAHSCTPLQLETGADVAGGAAE